MQVRPQLVVSQAQEAAAAGAELQASTPLSPQPSRVPRTSSLEAGTVNVNKAALSCALQQRVLEALVALLRCPLQACRSLPGQLRVCPAPRLPCEVCALPAGTPLTRPAQLSVLMPSVCGC